MNNSYSAFKQIITQIAIYLFYVIAGNLSLKLALLHPSVTSVWVPAGIATAAILLFGYRIWLAIFIGAFTVNIINTPSLGLALAIALGNTLGALTAGFFVNSYAAGKHFFEHLRNIFKFAFLAGVLATSISASIGAFSLILFKQANFNQFLSIWFTWWVGDLSGVIIIAFFIIIWFQQGITKYSLKSTLELFFLFLALIGISEITFGGLLTSGNLQNYPISIVNIPIILWLALRFTQRETITGIIVLSGLAIWGTLHGFGPFVRQTPNDSLIFLQIYLTITTLTGISITTLVAEREQSTTETQRLATIVESSEDAILSKNLKGIIQSWNKGAEELYGYKANEMIGKSAANLFPGERLDEYSYIMNQVIQGKKVEHFETERVSKGGEKIPVSVSISPLRNKFGVVIGASTIARDIRKKVELERLRNEFFSIAAHQLRTPLTSMRWTLEIVMGESKKPVDTTINKVLEKTYQSVLHMIFLVNRLLEVKKIEQGKVIVNPSQIDAFLKVQAIIKSMETEAKQRNTTITLTKSTDSLRYIIVDPEQFSEVVQNLLSNSLKYSRTAGGIIKVDLSYKDKALLLRVADNGIGIPAEEQSLIFKQFFRARNAATSVPEGSGLGLYMIKMIVENWNGKIWFESSEGKGTIFYIAIPVKDQK